MLDGAVRKQHRDAIDNRIAPGAAQAEDALRLKLQGLVTDRADDPAEVFGRDWPYAHISILATAADGGKAGRDTMKEMKNTPGILDGVAIAGQIKAEVAIEVKELAGRGITPGLAVILVGEVPASQIYVRSKVKTCGELGIYSEMLTPPESITTDEMLALVAGLNAREDIDGILIQLPLPKHVDTKRLLEAVSPDKDVDGFHPVNVGRLQSGQPGLAPCTPAGIIEILKRSDLPIAGQNAVVVGRSDIVGKPAAMMLLNASATVTVCHSRTKDLAKFTREADLLVAAIGRPGFVTAEMVKPGATLIDVGNQSCDGCRGGRRLLSRRCSAGSDVRQTRLGGGGRHSSGGVCDLRRLYSCPRWRGCIDDCHADAKYGDRGQIAPGNFRGEGLIHAARRAHRRTGER